MSLGDPYLSVDKAYEEQGRHQDAYENFLEEFDFAELLAGCDEIGDLALAVINEDTVALKKWKQWIDDQAEQAFIREEERAKKEAAEDAFDRYLSSSYY